MNKLPKSIGETQSMLLKKEVSAAELTKAYLNRIHKQGEQLNAFITVTDKHALKQAELLDKGIADLGKDATSRFPLLGVTLSLKDLYLTKGIRTTAASKVLDQYIPEYSATAVTRLEQAGCILVGKNNCDAWAHGASGENSDYGPTKNPWNLEYVPGGSCSGSAVSVASDLSLISMGTDTGGSIRQPASFCNVVGLKPTYGRVPRYGVVAMASSLDSMGHFTHYVADSRKVLSVTSGEDGHDDTVKNSPATKAVSRKLTIGVPKEYFIEGLDKEVRSAVEEAIDYYRNHDIQIKAISLPTTKYAISVYYIVQPAEVSSNLGRYDGIRYGNTRDFMGDEAKRRIMLGTYVLSSGYYDAYYLKAMKVRRKIVEDFEKAFEEVDAIIAPVSPTPPFKLGEKASDPLQMYLADIFTVAANLAGIPGLAIPAGFSTKKLPLGFQLLGPRFSENTLFDLGELYQQETTWHLQEPAL